MTLSQNKITVSQIYVSLCQVNKSTNQHCFLKDLGQWFFQSFYLLINLFIHLFILEGGGSISTKFRLNFLANEEYFFFLSKDQKALFNHFLYSPGQENSSYLLLGNKLNKLKQVTLNEHLLSHNPGLRFQSVL